MCSSKSWFDIYKRLIVDDYDQFNCFNANEIYRLINFKGDQSCYVTVKNVSEGVLEEEPTRVRQVRADDFFDSRYSPFFPCHDRLDDEADIADF